MNTTEAKTQALNTAQDIKNIVSKKVGSSDSARLNMKFDDTNTAEDNNIKKEVEQMATRNKTKDVVCCLKAKRVIVRHVPKQGGMVTNPKHILYGGMAENAARYFTVPILASTGAYKNVLTDSEKAYLEEVMGLEFNALSVYKKENNFWDNFQVRLTKQDNFLDLSNPEDYIKYKVLKANTDYIADSLDTLYNKPKKTYQFVIVDDKEQEERDSLKMTNTMKCYLLFGTMQDNLAKLSCVIELLTGRAVAKNQKAQALYAKINELIQADPVAFLQVVQDPHLDAKVLIKQGLSAGVIVHRGDQYFLKAGNQPLCNNNADPTLSVAAKFLDEPNNKDIRIAIESAVNK